MDGSASASSSRGKYAQISAAKKKELCLMHLANPQWTQAALVAEFAKEHGIQIKRNTASDILRAKEKWLAVDSSNKRSNMARKRDAAFPLLESALVAWIRGLMARDARLSYGAIQQKALNLRDEFMVQSTDAHLKAELKGFKATTCWVKRSKDRNGLAFVTMHGESDSADPENVAEAQARLPAALAGYAAEDIYNFDEMGLFYKAQPNRTIAEGKVRGRRIPKDRITIGCGVNVLGSNRLPLVLVHKSAHAALAALLTRGGFACGSATKPHG